MTKKIGFISLGCDKNRVDLEKMMFRLKSAGFELVDNLQEANIILINTCAFIASARKESIDNILEIVSSKGKNNLENIVVSGCLAERYSEELHEAIPEIDAIVKLAENNEIEKIICSLVGESAPKIGKNANISRVLSNSPHFAYLKISDGCNNCCSYCTIPRIRGRYRSTPMEDLLAEAENLAKLGVKELIIVAQDTTRYGTDLYGEPKLCELIEKLSKIKTIERIRLHYCYPEMIGDELLHMIETNHKICGYLDIPFQHIDDKILKSMNRRSTSAQIIELINKIRSLKRKVAIRSTFIIGYPGETRLQFKHLCDFIKKFKLDNVGFFAYSREERTSAGFMKNQVPEFIKKRRLKHIQKLQEKISTELCRSKIGQTQNILIDGFDEVYGYFYGRDEFNSVGIDFDTIIEASDLVVGNFYKVRIVDFENGVYKGELL